MPELTDFQLEVARLFFALPSLDRFANDEIPVPDGFSVPELRAFYATWRSELMAREPRQDEAKERVRSE
jgi:hypothetical protein